MKQISNVVLHRDEKILLGRRTAKRAFYPDCWALFGGHLEIGETPAEAAIRELREELGIAVHNLKSINSFVASSAAEPIMFHIFACHHWTGSPTLAGDEHSQMQWFDIATASERTDLALARIPVCLSFPAGKDCIICDQCLFLPKSMIISMNYHSGIFNSIS